METNQANILRYDALRNKEITVILVEHGTDCDGKKDWTVTSDKCNVIAHSSSSFGYDGLDKCIEWFKHLMIEDGYTNFKIKNVDVDLDNEIIETKPIAKRNRNDLDQIIDKHFPPDNITERQMSFITHLESKHNIEVLGKDLLNKKSASSLISFLVDGNIEQAKAVDGIDIKVYSL